jgi:hypothetical protein
MVCKEKHSSLIVYSISDKGRKCYDIRKVEFKPIEWQDGITYRWLEDPMLIFYVLAFIVNKP